MKVKVDRDLCVGIGNCVAVAPDVFKIDAHNKAVIKNNYTISDDKLMNAAGSCPVNAIIIEDDAGQQIFP